MLIDTHAHLYWESYKEDFDEVIQRAKNANITTIFNIGVDVEKSKVAADMENGEIKFYSTIGIHPHEVLRLSFDKLKIAQDQQLDFDVSIQQDINELEQIYRQNPKKVIGVGECGLDFLFPSSAEASEDKGSSLSIEQIKDLQKQLFQAQINLAKKLNLPLIVHCRDDRSKNPENIECWNEALRMISGYKGILHCYSGTMHITQRTMNHELTNFLISFAANITYPKNDYLKEAAKFLPLEKICLETDSPFLSPQSKRGQRNEPCSVLEVAKTISEVKNIPLDKIFNQTTVNVKKLFNLLSLG